MGLHMIYFSGQDKSEVDELSASIFRLEIVVEVSIIPLDGPVVAVGILDV
jgi:hypothetical protein